jgi:hypothetical protein
MVTPLPVPLDRKLTCADRLLPPLRSPCPRPPNGLHVLRRPSNLKTSYIATIDGVLKKFDDRFLLPIKQMSREVSTVLDLMKLVPTISNSAESEYMREAIDCANAGYRKAAVVLGWCAAVDRMQRKILAMGLQTFNDASTTLKNKTTGKFGKWNKEFKVTTMAELQTVFDTDLLTVLEGLDLLDGNQAERLRTCFQYRNHSAHPGEAPVDEPHLVAFFTDVASVILQNPKFAIAG